MSVDGGANSYTDLASSGDFSISGNPVHGFRIGPGFGQPYEPKGMHAMFHFLSRRTRPTHAEPSAAASLGGARVLTQEEWDDALTQIISEFPLHLRVPLALRRELSP